MALFGNIAEFAEAKESWPQYAARFEQFFDANDIAVDKRSIFLSAIGPIAYHTLEILVSPRKPQEETYANLLNLMSAYYNRKPLATVQRYKFYSRFRQSNKSISSTGDGNLVTTLIRILSKHSFDVYSSVTSLILTRKIQ